MKSRIISPHHSWGYYDDVFSSSLRQFLLLPLIVVLIMLFLETYNNTDEWFLSFLLLFLLLSFLVLYQWLSSVVGWVCRPLLTNCFFPPHYAPSLLFFNILWMAIALCCGCFSFSFIMKMFPFVVLQNEWWPYLHFSLYPCHWKPAIFSSFHHPPLQKGGGGADFGKMHTSREGKRN